MFNLKRAKFLVFCISFTFFSLAVFSQTISAEEAKNYIGKTVTVLGKVVDGRYLSSTSSQPTLLNIDKRYPNQIFSIVIYGINRQAFGYKPEEALLNKNVFVTGKVQLYKGKPQITVATPNQIVIAAGGESASELSKEAPPITAEGDVVLKTMLKLRAGPGNNYKSITKLKAGSVVKILHADNSWTYVSVTKTPDKEKNFTLVGFIKTSEIQR